MPCSITKPLYATKATTQLCLPAPQLHQTILPPSTHDKIFWCCGAFFFSRDLRPGNRFAILHTHLDNRISRPDWIQRHDLAELRASLTTPLQNRGRNLIRGERRTTTDTSIHIHTPMPGFENLYPLLNLDFQNLRKKAKSKYRPVATISQIEIASHALVVLVGECLPQTLLYTLRVILGFTVFVYIAPRRSYPDDKEVQ